VPGAAGVIRFEIGETPDLARSRFTPWLATTVDDDFIAKTRVTGLAPGRTYFYRAHHGVDPASAQPGPIARFRTLPGPGDDAAVRFVQLSCMHYARFFGLMPDAPARQLPMPERLAGYPGLDAVRRAEPDFWISNGDNVYYDHPEATAARTVPAMRQKWHEQAVLPRLLALNASAAAFYLKDDHDFRFDDADLTGDRLPTAADGIRLFREQVPIIDPATPTAPTYRTVRAGRNLQLWFLESRDHRSPNALPDGPGKSLWGADQLAWLQRTLKASDATFKIIVSPNPLIGPDDLRKRDNHTNHGGFRHEGGAFFTWLQAEGFDPQRLLILTGDRHWKYHSIHPSGFHEWSAGAIHPENARAGRAPGDPQSTDAVATIRQLHRDDRPVGGFLLVEISAGGSQARARLSLLDEAGQPVHTQTYPAPTQP